MMALLESLGPVRTVGREGAAVTVVVDLPEAGIGDHMAGVLRVAAGGDAEVIAGDGRDAAAGLTTNLSPHALMGVRRHEWRRLRPCGGRLAA